MPRVATGSVYQSRGRYYASITIAKGKRPSFALATAKSDEEANARASTLAALAVDLRRGAVEVTLAERLLERAAGSPDGKPLAEVLDAARAIASGEAKRIPTPRTGAGATTFKGVAKRWTSGELARDYPDQVKAKRTAAKDLERLEKHVFPFVPDAPIAEFTLDHAEAVMRALSADKRVRSPSTRRQVAQVMRRVLELAVFPLRLIAANPIPRGFMPKPGASKAKAWLYPAEDRKLLGAPSEKVPLNWRVFYGFLDREGMRAGEAERLTWGDFDLERGAVRLDENKTDDPRAWALDPGVTRGLAAWLSIRKASGASVEASDLVFELRADEGHYDAAKLFRRHLKSAGVDRAELHDPSAVRLRIRRHDLRATFVTLNLAAGKSETWVADRTGHKSSAMINRYRRAARTASELGLGALAPLDVAIPELAADAPYDPAKATPPKADRTRKRARGNVGGNVGARKRRRLSVGSGAGIRTPIRGFKDGIGRGEASRGVESPRETEGAGDVPRPLARSADTSEGPADVSEQSPKSADVSAPNPRAALVADLGRHVAELATAGDLLAARIAAEALTALLEDGTDRAAVALVVDLAAERARRRSAR